MRLILSAMALTMLAACGGGNPFGAAGTGVVSAAGGNLAVPAAIANDVDGFAFNATTLTLSMTGVGLDVPSANYMRNAAQDVPGYIAFTAQDDPLDQHMTAYAQKISAVSGALVASGGQFTYYNGGAVYNRDSGAYDPDTVTGQVSYAGDYVGLTNVNGPDTDLKPVPPGTDPSVTPTQAAQIQGKVFFNADFGDNTMKGVIYSRTVDRLVGGTVALPNLVLVPTTIAADGTFAGDLNREGEFGDLGDYAGVFGGTDSEAVAGAITAKAHWDVGTPGLSDIEEYGIFVLGKCGSAVATDPICAPVN